MTQDQRTAFETLRKDRMEADSALQKPALKGVKNTIADMYTGKAHFVYELLQNADDAQATNAWFDIFPDRLEFRHDGTKQFNITLLPDESGDVNAITSFANSNKDTNSIGKFGIGFKAVFLYTEEPVVYTRNFSFRIVRWIVPELIEDIPATINPFLSEGQTVFVFPFKKDHQEEAVSVIGDTLFNLQRPMLFLKTLRNIRISRDGQRQEYSLRLERISTNGTTVFEKVFCEKAGQEPHVEWLLKATRPLENSSLSCSVAFAMSDDWSKLVPCPGPVHCYFPTQDNPDLKFLVHAPFLVTNNRGNIQDNDHNAGLVSAVGDLAADTLVFLRDWGITRGTAIIDDSIFNIIPTDRSKYYELRQMFAPVFDKIRECMKFRGMLSTVETEPLSTRYVVGKDAYWAESTDIPVMFPNRLLSMLLGNPTAKWVFTASGRPVASGDALIDYKDKMTAGWISFMGRYIGDDHCLVDKISPEFLAKQSREWLTDFYRFILHNEGRAFQLERIKSLPLFLRNDGTFQPASKLDSVGKVQPCLFLPTADGVIQTVPLLHPDLLTTPELLKFFRETLCLSEPSIRDEVFNTILPKYKPGIPVESPMEDMKLVFRAWKNGTTKDREDIGAVLQKTPCFLSDEGKWLRPPSSLYLPSDELNLWFQGQDVHYLAESVYKEQFADVFQDFLEFVRFVGVSEDPRETEREGTEKEISLWRNDSRFPTEGHDHHWKINTIEGLEKVFERIVSKHDRQLSLLLWKTLAGHIPLENCFKAEYKYVYYKDRTVPFQSPILEKLRRSAWLCSKTGEWIAPEKSNIRDLEVYETATPAAKALAGNLGVSTSGPSITPEQEEKLKRLDEWEQLLAQKGLSIETVIQRTIEYPTSVPSVYTWPRIDFTEVSSWWKTASAEQLAIYNESLYGVRDAIPLREDSRKSAWMELLILGACHTLGGFQLEAHRGFIRWMKSNDFWSIVCNDPVPPQSWIRFLDRFLDSNELSPEFSYWMSLFPRIYQFSRHWREYKDVFLWWNDPEMVPKSVQDLSAFQTNPLLQQTGIKAPGLQKALGTVGVHFVFRELVRRGAIKNSSLDPFCFVPYQGLCDRLGVEQSSQAIHSLVTDAIGREIVSFGNAFDIAISSYLRCHP